MWKGLLPLVAAVLLAIVIAGFNYSHRGTGSSNTTTIITTTTSIITTTTSAGPLQMTVSPGTRISNFLLQRVNANDTVSGLLYIEYPVAYANGTPVTLRIGSSIGYACDATEWRLSAVDPYNGTATFSYVQTEKGHCPI